MKLPIIKGKEDFDEHFQSLIWSEAAREICRQHQIFYSELKRSASSDHIVFLIDDSLVLKIYRPFRRCFEREKKSLEFINGKTDFNIPDIVQIGEIEGFNYVLMTQLPGIAMTRAGWLTLPKNEQLEFVSNLAVGLKQIHELNACSIDCDWAEFVEDRANTFIERQIRHGVNSKIIQSLPAFIETNLKLVPTDCPTPFMHGDVHFGNLRLSKTSGVRQIAGLFDFADSRRGFHEYDFLAVGILMIQGQGEVQREFFRAYGYKETELNEIFRRRMMMLTMLYESSDLRRYALRLKPEAVDFTLEELEKEIWSFAE
jgi:hygromycin-B 7''-O-kinase